MFSEHRIVLTIVLSFFIYGLSSLLSLGDFVTPFFFSKLIYVGVSLIFLLMNLRIKDWGYLLFGFLAMLSLAVADDFTIHIVTRGGQRIWMAHFLTNEIVLYFSLILFAGFYLSSIFLLRKITTNLWVFALLLVSLIVGLVFAYLNENIYFELAFALFLISYYIIVRRSDEPEKSVLSILSALFILQFFMELFKYLF